MMIQISLKLCLQEVLLNVIFLAKPYLKGIRDTGRTLKTQNNYLSLEQI